MNIKAKAIFSGGCFWCTEAIFQRLRGVLSVVPGYSGGTTKNPTYEAVCTGETGHAESIEITFDPSIIPFRVLTEIFFRTHDPTSLNRQGADMGTQYRSAIFYHSEEQNNIALSVKKQLEDEHVFKSPIVTEITRFSNFYEAEDYHKRYYEKNSYQPYCNVVIDPKVHKFMKEYGNLVKDEYNS